MRRYHRKSRGALWSVCAGLAMTMAAPMAAAQAFDLASPGNPPEPTPPVRTDLLLTAARVRIPYGTSLWEAALPTATPIGPIRVYWRAEPTCSGFRSRLEVYQSGTESWVPARWEQDHFVSSVPVTSRLRVFFYQNYWTYTDCEVSVRTSAPPPPRPGTPPTGPSPLPLVEPTSGGENPVESP